VDLADGKAKDDAGTDVSRMRQIIIQLKSQPIKTN
jgi:hypothetical protein